MRSLRLLLAFIGGSWIYYVAVILIGGHMAAISVPKGYFVYFGAEHNEFALVLLSLFTWAIPVGGFICAGLLALHRLVAPDSGVLVLWSSLLGMIVAFMFFAAAPAAGGLWQSFSFPWWAGPSFLAPWAGAALALWLSLRHRVTLNHA